jgi:hypothetical protein
MEETVFYVCVFLTVSCDKQYTQLPLKSFNSVYFNELVRNAGEVSVAVFKFDVRIW